MNRVAIVYGYGQLADGELDKQSIGRCRKALALYKTGEVKEIFLTVGADCNGVLMANKMAEWLVVHGVWTFDVATEPLGLNTAGETEICHRLVDKAERVTAISSWYHLPRIWLLWLLRGRLVRLAGSSEGVHLKDVLIEPLKLLNSTLRPFSSAKLIPPQPERSPA